MEFPVVSGVELCFVWNFQGQSKEMKNSREGKKVYPQPPLFEFFLEQAISF